MRSIALIARNRKRFAHPNFFKCRLVSKRHQCETSKSCICRGKIIALRMSLSSHMSSRTILFSLIHMVCFCTYDKKHIWEKHICFSVHMICKEHICSDFPCHLPRILYHHKLCVPTNFEYPQMVVPQTFSINKFLSMNTIKFEYPQFFRVHTNLSPANFE